MCYTPARKIMRKIAGQKDEFLATQKAALQSLVQLFAPMMPHLAETCWHLLGGAGAGNPSGLASGR